MRWTKVVLLFLVACPLLLADKADKANQKQLQAQAKTMVKEAKGLEKSGRLVEARKEYAQSQAFFATKDAEKGLKRVDDKLRQQVKEALAQAQRLYDAGQFHEAAVGLESALELATSTALIHHDLALCYAKLGDPAKAVESLNQAIAGTGDPKQRQKLLLLRASFITGETAPSLDKDEKRQVAEINQAASNVGLEATLDDPSADPAQVEASGDSAAQSTKRVAAIRPCSALEGLKGGLGTSASAAFDLATCAEANSRPDEAAKHLEHYLELAPKALDADDARTRLGELQALLNLSGGNGNGVRTLYASASRSIEERKYGQGLAGFLKADSLAPDFALTKWKLGLFYEAAGNVEQARTSFVRYQQLNPAQDDRHPADLHLKTLDARRAKYDEEVTAAREVLRDLLTRGLNLDFEEGGRGHRAERAQVSKHDQNKKAMKQVGGFAVPFGYAQQQLGLAAQHLQLALSIFPLGAEANELMAFVYLQANDGQSAVRCFDAVAGQNLPVAFYAECRGHKLDHAARCELSPSGLRLIFLSSYDKRGRPTPPDPPAGKDLLGDLVVGPATARQPQFDGFALGPADIVQVETKNGLVRVKSNQETITLSPIFLASYTPVEGPPARRFANTYTRLFIRYPSLEDSKLGKEGMTGMEKVRLGYAIANASANIAMSAIMPFSALAVVMEDVPTVLSLTRQLNGAMSSLKVNFSGWEKIVSDQQAMLTGDRFRVIPTDPPDFGFAAQGK